MRILILILSFYFGFSLILSDQIIYGPDMSMFKSPYAYGEQRYIPEINHLVILGETKIGLYNLETNEQYIYTDDCLEFLGYRSATVLYYNHERFQLISECGLTIDLNTYEVIEAKQPHEIGSGYKIMDYRDQLIKVDEQNGSSDVIIYDMNTRVRDTIYKTNENLAYLFSNQNEIFFIRRGFHGKSLFTISEEGNRSFKLDTNFVSIPTRSGKYIVENRKGDFKYAIRDIESFEILESMYIQEDLSRYTLIYSEGKLYSFLVLDEIYPVSVYDFTNKQVFDIREMKRPPSSFPFKYNGKVGLFTFDGFLYDIILEEENGDISDAYIKRVLPNLNHVPYDILSQGHTFIGDDSNVIYVPEDEELNPVYLKGLKMENFYQYNRGGVISEYGESIYYLSSDGDNDYIYQVDSRTDEVSEVVSSDISITSLAFDEFGNLYFTKYDGEKTELVRYDIQEERVKQTFIQYNEVKYPFTNIIAKENKLILISQVNTVVFENSETSFALLDNIFHTDFVFMESTISKHSSLNYPYLYTAHDNLYLTRLDLQTKEVSRFMDIPDVSTFTDIVCDDGYCILSSTEENKIFIKTPEDIFIDVSDQILENIPTSTTAIETVTSINLDKGIVKISTNLPKIVKVYLVSLMPGNVESKKAELNTKYTSVKLYDIHGKELAEGLDTTINELMTLHNIDQAFAVCVQKNNIMSIGVKD